MNITPLPNLLNEQLEQDLLSAMISNAENKLPYYQEWLYDHPFVISRAKFEQTKTLQIIFFKLINEFVLNFEQYSPLMPLSPKAQRIIDIWQAKDTYDIGTYRTDFVFDENGNFRPIEITCRFALNGFFTPSILNSHIQTRRYSKEASDYLSPYDTFYKFFIRKLNHKRKVFVLRDSEMHNESKLFDPIFRQADIEIQYVTVKDLNAGQCKFDDCLVINELTFDELMELNEEAHYTLSASNVMNDLRTVFLVHDKRFFAVINDAALQRNCLTEDEIRTCQALFIPSEIYTKNSKCWINAKDNKDKWILKHRALGKSESVYAGIVTEQKEWQAMFRRPDIHDFVLQEWVPQTTYPGSIKGQQYNDYVTGTCLFCNNHHFGFAEFRTSSFPVTNKADHRKSVSLIVSDDEHYNFDLLQKKHNIGII